MGGMRIFRPAEPSRQGRWSALTAHLIRCEDGAAYLFRRQVIRTPWLRVFIHDIHETDQDRHLHDHPWSFISIILSGGYTELYCEDSQDDPWVVEQRRWPRFSVHLMRHTAAHRIIDASPGLRTLVIAGPRRQDWGFHTENGFVGWRAYHGVQEAA